MAMDDLSKESRWLHVWRVDVLTVDDADDTLSLLLG